MRFNELNRVYPESVALFGSVGHLIRAADYNLDHERLGPGSRHNWTHEEMRALVVRRLFHNAGVLLRSDGWRKACREAVWDGCRVTIKLESPTIELTAQVPILVWLEMTEVPERTALVSRSPGWR